MKLDPTVSAPRPVDFDRRGLGEALPQASHAERITISEMAREASQSAGQPVLGDVRWYRAVHRNASNRRGAQVVDEPAWRASAASAQTATGYAVARNARSAVAAYLANTPLAA